MYDVITVGSAITDTFIESKDFEIVKRRGLISRKGICLNYGSKIEIEDIVTSTGGGGTNTAASFARLGFKTAFLGKIGPGYEGARILNMLEEEKISKDFVVRGNKKTGQSIIVVGAPGECTIMVYRGANGTLKSSEVNWRKLNAKWFYLSHMRGSGAGVLQRVLVHARKNGAKIAINPGSTQIKQGIEKLGRVDILILNKEEAELVAKTRDQNKSLKKLNKFADIVVITNGKKGSIAFDGEKIYHARIYKSRIVDTVGAGDAFGSGFTAGIIMGRGIEYALRLGSKNAASVVSHINTKDGLIRNTVSGDLKVRVKKID